MPFPITGKMSSFGGPADLGVAWDEDLALVFREDLADYGRFGYLFLPEQPAGTTGLARMLNPAAFYLAMRWNYSQVSKEVLRQSIVKLKANGKTIFARPVDWGPNDDTGRVADLSPGCCAALGLDTDDEVTGELITP